MEVWGEHVRNVTADGSDDQWSTSDQQASQAAKISELLPDIKTSDFLLMNVNPQIGAQNIKIKARSDSS